MTIPPMRPAPLKALRVLREASKLKGLPRYPQPEGRAPVDELWKRWFGAPKGYDDPKEFRALEDSLRVAFPNAQVYGGRAQVVDSLRPGINGKYHFFSGNMGIADDLTRDDARSTLAHEYGHATVTDWPDRVTKDFVRQWSDKGSALRAASLAYPIRVTEQHEYVPELLAQAYLGLDELQRSNDPSDYLERREKELPFFKQASLQAAKQSPYHKRALRILEQLGIGQEQR